MILDGYGRRRLLVNKDNCPGFVEMVKRFAYPVGSDGQIKSENPLPFMKDEFDAVHYGIDDWIARGQSSFGQSGGLLTAI